MRQLLIASLALLAACGGGDGGGSTAPTPRSVSTYLTAVRLLRGTTTVAAPLRTGTAPSAAGGGTVTVQRVGALLAGGTAQVRLRSAIAFSRAIVAIDGTTDFYDVSLPAPDTVAVLTLTVAQSPPQSSFALRYATQQGNNVSTYAIDNATLTAVGTGAIQLNVSWDTATDVDLYLVEPGGRVVYYGAPTSNTGARLDLDSNAGCALDNRNAENITYAAGVTPPSGQYIVRVNYFSNCRIATPTTYIVTLTVRGTTQTFTGSFTGAGTSGGATAGTEITRFTF
ncbi:MAG: hypothetical protein MUF00_20350 [Gemmatimonadaceae bacterium]|jgi:hypothetical protein|nr:hypothetical protein [Gemmatimonadaceae bacterium]